MEREKGFEPSTSTLARLHSTTELLPQKNLKKTNRTDYARTLFPIKEWAEEDSNLQGFPHELLRLARLPVSPSARNRAEA